MATAAGKTLAIPELLEAVLLELPPRDLILSQRVNKSFKTAVEKSRKIQQKLFFKQPPSENEATAAINPLLGRVFRYLSTQCKIFIGRSDSEVYYGRHDRHIWEDAPADNLRMGRDREQINILLFNPIGTSTSTTSGALSFEKMLIADSSIHIFTYPRGRVFDGGVTADDATVSIIGEVIAACRPELVDAMGQVRLNEE